MKTELKASTPASLRAVFRFGQSRQVRVELDISFTGGGDRSEDPLAEIARIIDGNRHHQRLDPACRECEWHQVLDLVRRCHELASLVSGRLVTSVRIEEGGGEHPELESSAVLTKSAAAVARAPYVRTG